MLYEMVGHHPASSVGRLLHRGCYLKARLVGFPALFTPSLKPLIYVPSAYCSSTCTMTPVNHAQMVACLVDKGDRGLDNGHLGMAVLTQALDLAQSDGIHCIVGQQREPICTQYAGDQAECRAAAQATSYKNIQWQVNG